MRDKPLSNQVGELCKKLKSVGLSTTAKLLNEVIGDRSVTEHEKWDDLTYSKTQEKIIDSLAEGIHTLPKEKPEIAPSDLRSFENIPSLEYKSSQNSQNNTELRALETTGVLKCLGKKILISNPGKLINGVVSLLQPEQIWRAFELRLKIKGLFDGTILPIRTQLKRVASKDGLLYLSNYAACIYGVGVHPVSAKQIYEGAPNFISRAGSGTALTMSTSSGIIDPLERFGTDYILKWLNIGQESPLATKINKKDEWRVVNFDDGLLSRKYQAERLYFFDCKITSSSLKGTIDLLADEEKKKRYIKRAAKLLAEALEHPNFQLYAVPSFESWMTKYTRSAPGHTLISFRHPDTHSICDGIELNFRDPEKLHNWFSRIFRWVEYPAKIFLPLEIAVMLAAESEEAVWHYVNKKILRKDLESEIRKVSIRVRLSGKNKKEKEEFAYHIINELISSGTIKQLDL